MSNMILSFYFIYCVQAYTEHPKSCLDEVFAKKVIHVFQSHSSLVCMYNLSFIDIQAGDIIYDKFFTIVVLLFSCYLAA